MASKKEIQQKECKKLVRQLNDILIKNNYKGYELAKHANDTSRISKVGTKHMSKEAKKANREMVQQIINSK